MSKFPYCEKCLEQPTTNKEQYEFYDYRFWYPVCVKCVREYRLEPDESETI